ncbi:MAG TPA: alcohol dehydrogenase catalytic domain-containing protein [Anaeromyxobacteraceae bacterium]|nr:alcohol dehydrogenase catalytic domain-containing protein [Anaeromyxobacteraceae bacterium]
MRAIRYHGPRRPLSLEEVAAPEPGPDEVLVRVTAAGVCHTDLHFVSGLLDLGVAPLTLGHEIVGRVERVGAAVPPGRVGERVQAGGHRLAGRDELEDDVGAAAACELADA